MPTLSILTAAYAPSAGFLPETIASVASLEMPPGWDVEWIVQEDGDTPVLGRHFTDLPGVRYAANRTRLGIGGTRNLALERASGSLLRVLDVDDLLLPGAAADLIPYFTDNRIHWAVGQADDLMTDGRRISWDPLIPTGLVKAGAVNDYAIENGGNWPIHCAGLTARTETVRALGGWAASITDEDLILFAALSEVSDGYNHPAISWLYRQHSGQATRTDEWRSKSESGRRMALQRAHAARRLKLAIDHNSAPEPGEAVREFRVDRALKDREMNEYL
ncbi:glycosyltransferase family 2 protein [Actinoplanes subtropicus]|uniref:glycosyltransferase family 2 protein n=1 Tax=Actinoplanes subtropicus TaxID=543632 RepID=UPI000A03876C|nr:glycosyltransferase [Actinoplanes subtropicus]